MPRTSPQHSTCSSHQPLKKSEMEMTNLKGFRKHGDKWKRMDEIDLHVYIGLLILAGVYRSRGEATCSLWDAESGRVIFPCRDATESLSHFLKKATI